MVLAVSCSVYESPVNSEFNVLLKPLLLAHAMYADYKLRFNCIIAPQGTAGILTLTFVICLGQVSYQRGYQKQVKSSGLGPWGDIS